LTPHSELTLIIEKNHKKGTFVKCDIEARVERKSAMSDFGAVKAAYEL